MNILILESDSHNTAIIESIVRQQLGNIEFLHKSPWIEEGISILRKKSINLVICNLELDDACGTEILNRLEAFSDYVICISSNSRFAYEAVKFSFVKDYLIRPINIDELRCSISRFKAKLRNNYVEKPWLANNSETFDINKISYTSNQRTEYIDLNNIIRVEAMRSYCKVILNNKRSLVYSKPLSSIIKHFPQDIFFRVHKSHLINLKYVETLNKNGTVSLKMNEEPMIPIARERKKEFKAVLESF